MPKCDKCGRPMRVQERKNGSGQFLSCTGYKEGCSNTRNLATLDDVIDAIHLQTKRLDRLGQLLGFLAESLHQRNQIEGLDIPIPQAPQPPQPPMPPVQTDLPHTPKQVDINDYGGGIPDSPFSDTTAPF